MFGMGMGELVLILVVALLVVGPDKLPDAAKAIGKGIRDFRRHTQDLQETLEQDEKLGEAVRELRSALRDDPFRPRPRPIPPPPAAPALPPGEQGSDRGDGASAAQADADVHADAEGNSPAPADPHAPPVVIPAANTVAKQPARPAPAPPVTNPAPSPSPSSPSPPAAASPTEPAPGDDSAHG